MIQRYTTPEMGVLWTELAKKTNWLEVEAAVLQARGKLGEIPEIIHKLTRRVKITEAILARADELEKTNDHDLIAFILAVTEQLPDKVKPHFHAGMTSYDDEDTGLAMTLVASLGLILEKMNRLRRVIAARAEKHRYTTMIGRTHFIHAEPITFGLKLAGYYAEFQRAKERLAMAKFEIATCAISGAVGTFANVDPRVEEHVAKMMGLTVEPVSTQVIPRDRHAAYFCALGVVASSIERLATEIRHLQRTEVLEAEEPFDVGQKGSSAMPHKRNPILTENLTGLARLVRSAVTPAMENVALWHERDISHSSVERGIGPDATVHLDFALRRMASVIERFNIYPENMARNLDKLGGLVFSQRVMLALTQEGVSREDAYAAVQGNSMKVWRGEGKFIDFLKADPVVSKALSDKVLEELFDYGYHTKNVDVIFRRVFGEQG